MTFQDYFPIWNKLQTDQQDRIRSNLNFRTVKKGTILHNGDMDCTGLLLVKAGQLRAYILSDEGREITIYRTTAGKNTLATAWSTSSDSAALHTPTRCVLALTIILSALSKSADSCT